jgi:hypothetical protein
MKSSLCAALVSLLLVLAASCMTSGDPVPPTDEASQTASPPASDDDLDLTQEDLEMLDVFGQQCGSAVCSGRTHCCNASCSRCVPFGVECPQVACLTTDPATK